MHPDDNRDIIEALVEFEKAEAARDAELAPDDLVPQFTEEGLALRFSEKYASTLRYVAMWGRWFEWTGSVWKQDSTLRIFHYIREICRAAALSPEATPSCAFRLNQARTVVAVEKLARSDRRHAAVVDQWDVDPLLLNTPAGIVDLTTGQLKPSDPLQYMTKITSASPGGECPTWLNHLATVTGGDVELQDFIRRMCGYCLTGLTIEQVLFFFFGTGANGKSVTVETFLRLLGTYSHVAPAEMFLASNTDHHPCDVAALQGARLVVAQEVDAGRRWNESRVKSLTGSDRISARFMRMDYFQFTPIFKLIIVGNHRPALRTVDEAIRRRLRLLPFGVTIPKDQRDPDLTEKLRAEWAGILRWAIQGCLDWQAQRLGAPQSVVAATESYLEDEDSIQRWIQDRCVVDRRQ
jgi:putative DNA primase/helicase